MERAFGAKAGTLAFDRRMAGITAVEIFAQRVGNARLDARAQRIADVEILPGNAKGQGCLRGKRGVPDFQLGMPPRSVNVVETARPRTAALS